MSKFSFKNPFSQTWEQYKKAAEENANTRIQKQAEKVYKDKPYSIEYLGVYSASKVLKSLSNVVSVSTCIVAFYLALKGLLNAYLAAFLAISVAALLEFIKNSAWKIGTKSKMKYQNNSIALFSMLIVLHLFSIAASGFGAFRLPELFPQTKIQNKKLVNVDSINQSYLVQIEAIDIQINSLAKNAANSSTTRATIKELTNQKTTTKKAQNIAIESAKAQNIVIEQKNNKTALEDRAAYQKQLSIIKWSSMGAALLFELLYIVCALFIYHYLFRAYVQSVNGDVTQNNNLIHNENNDSRNDKRNSSDQRPHSPTNKIGFIDYENKEVGGKKELDYTRICLYDECKKPYIHRSHNQKYCEDKCRIAAWEKRTGKKLTKVSK